MKYHSIEFEFFNTLFEYKDGFLYWKVRKGQRGKPGLKAGCIVSGYRKVQLGGTGYFEHRIIWVLHYGSLSEKLQIDHIDGNKLNNKIENLRLCKQHQNSQNRGATRNNKCGLKGVSFHKRDGIWQAYIQSQKKSIYLGKFQSKEDAFECYKEAALKLHGDYAKF